MAQIFGAIGLTGGTSESLDGIRVDDNSLASGDRAIVYDDAAAAIRFYKLGYPEVSESPPDYIAPDYSTGDTAYEGGLLWELIRTLSAASGGLTEADAKEIAMIYG